MSSEPLDLHSASLSHVFSGGGDRGSAAGFLTVGVAVTCIGCSPKWGLGTTCSRAWGRWRLPGEAPDPPTQGSQAVEGRQTLGRLLFCSVIYSVVGNFYNL